MVYYSVQIETWLLQSYYYCSYGTNFGTASHFKLRSMIEHWKTLMKVFLKIFSKITAFKVRDNNMSQIALKSFSNKSSNWEPSEKAKNWIQSQFRAISIYTWMLRKTGVNKMWSASYWKPKQLFSGSLSLPYWKQCTHWLFESLPHMWGSQTIG